jgi:hypothetical protein
VTQRWIKPRRFLVQASVEILIPQKFHQYTEHTNSDVAARDSITQSRSSFTRRSRKTPQSSDRTALVAALPGNVYYRFGCGSCFFSSLQVSKLNEPICVGLGPAPLGGATWAVYQKVQSSTGSTLKAL